MWYDNDYNKKNTDDDQHIDVFFFLCVFLVAFGRAKYRKVGA